jgi:histidinol-phosphate aminotransferase
MAGYSYGTQPDSADVIKLNTNENPYAPSPRIADVLRNFDVESLRRYPPATANPVRDAAARLHGVGREHVIVTNGGDELLRLAVTTFLDPGTPLGVLSPSYSLYPVLAAVQGCPTVEVDLGADWQPPADAAARLDAAGARLAFVVNPHAPSGTLASAATLAAFARAFRGVVLVDEAYVDFVSPARAHDLTGLVHAHPNVLLLRTLSKGYALAGLRLGYGIGRPELIAPMLTKTRDSYNVDTLAQAVAVAALTDQPWRDELARRVRDARADLHHRLAALGIACPDSESNFLLAHVPAGARRCARELHDALRSRDIFVRWFDQPRLRDCLRITVGTPAQNDALLAALAALLS